MFKNRDPRHKRDNTITYVAIFLFFILAIAALGSPAGAQEVVVVDETTSDAELIDNALKGALLILGAVLTWVIRNGVKMLPPFIAAWIDSKRQRDLQSAILTKVSDLISEGRWPALNDITDVGQKVFIPDSLVSEIHNYVVESVPQAAKHNNLVELTPRAERILSALAVRKSIEVAK